MKKIFFIILAVLVVFSIAYTIVIDIYESNQCESRGMTWVDLSFAPNKPTVINSLTIGKYSGWYQEKFSSGYCVSENPPVK